MELCSGLIVGMGESLDDIVDVVMELRDLRVASIPVNFLHAIDGTPLEAVHVLNPRYCLKVLCLLRLAHPATEIRIAGGREVNLRSMQSLGLYPANSLFVSDYLTTKGQSASADYEMIADLGFEVVIAGQEDACWSLDQAAMPAKKLLPASTRCSSPLDWSTSTIKSPPVAGESLGPYSLLRFRDPNRIVD